MCADAIERLRARIGPACEDGAQDALLRILLDDAEAFVLAYTGRGYLPDALTPAQVEIALHQYNRRGIEGMSANAEGSVSVHVDGLPERLQAMLNPYRVARIIKMT